MPAKGAGISARRCESAAARILSDLAAGTAEAARVAMSSQAIAYHRTISKGERSIAFYKPRPARDAKRRGKYYPLRNNVSCVHINHKNHQSNNDEMAIFL